MGILANEIKKRPTNMNCALLISINYLWRKQFRDTTHLIRQCLDEATFISTLINWTFFPIAFSSRINNVFNF